MPRFGFNLLLIFIPFNLLAQGFAPQPDWRFENFNSQNHFVSREISGIAVDQRGYVWTCSVGLQRFDGYQTTEFTTYDRAKGSLRSNYAGILADEDGRVWVTAFGLCYYDDQSGKFIYIDAGPQHHFTNVSGLIAQGDHLWLACELGLAKLNIKSLKVTFTSLSSMADPLCIFQIDDNNLLISSREKVYIYNIKNDTYSVHTLIYNHSLVKIFTAAKKGSEIFVGTNYGMFTINDLKNISLVSQGPQDIVVDDLKFLPQDKERKYLFLATEGKGLMVYNTISRKVEFTYEHDESNPFSLPNNIISKLFTDKKGRLWLATDLGISMLDIANQQLKMRFLNKETTEELGINKINRDKYDSSKVWMSSYNQGMICVNWTTKKVEQIFNRDAESRTVYDFAQLSKDRWLIASQKKIMEWSPQSGVMVTKELPLPDSLRILCNIHSLIMADAGACYITTNRGLFRYDLLTHQVSIAAVTDSKKHADLLKYILLGGFFDNGIIWAASRNGLFTYDVSAKTTTVYRGRGGEYDYFFFDLARAANNNVACAAGNGIFLFNTETRKFTPIHAMGNTVNPLCVNVIGIENRIWAGTEAGILNYNVDTRQFNRAFDETSLMEVLPSSSFALIGNQVVFGFRNGYAYFTPIVKNSLLPSDPVIETILVNNQAVLQPSAQPGKAGKLIFSHADNAINIAFTAFLYNNPDHVGFRYRLAGSSQGWQYAKDQHSANYAQLEPGDYTFYVQSGNKNGAWNNHLASFGFTIDPPYWETWWFRMLAIALIAFMLYRLYLYRVKSILAVERIRERIASDFHDEVGSALSSISIFSEVANKQLKDRMPHEGTSVIIDHISSNSRAMLDAMDDIIWAVDPLNDHIKDLAVRMREFAIPLLEARNINFIIDIPKDILNTRIKMEARKNMFLIFKESINNILKHSCCSKMGISVKKSNNQLELIISDNGKGFDVNAPHTRNGLKNMHKRAAEIRASLAVTTNPGEGTVVRLMMNII